ncbi:FAD-dependent monooxygenase [Pseudonocardia sp. C8]|uniref:FAD-dependent monooxygenase n=1 Tax=Pseudonocardia sp. C8 TaxID=2762759 RepID=UPI001642BAFE|nr:FAD-dependent monooxygenase [Pseudonocardia sp. C8]MBC3194230.1 FAD-dependent monooxygenase [Pseudonocardia sp. C8]
MQTIDTDVLVVGAGPAGLTASALLARDGVDALTVTKYPGTAHSPRAHITNQRTMEVFRDLGMEDAVRAVATPNELMGNNVWSTSFAAPELARLSTWGTAVERVSDYTAASPSRMCNIPQHLLEPVVLDRALDLGADIRFSTELISITQDEHGVRAVVRHRDTGERTAVRARYAIGADGGRSTVAEQLGFPFEGESGLGAAANVWLEADLTRYCAHRPGTLYWMCRPGNDYWVGSGTWICVTPWTEWVLLFMYDPADEPDLGEKAVLERARTTIGDPGVDIRIKAVSTWQINRVVATRFRQGRVFLAGDAAHRHPPANGLGTNTSIQDSYNLCWKLTAVLRGAAGEELLDSYDAERRPVGKQVVDRAMKSVADMAPITSAFGFRPGQTAEEGWAALDGLLAPTDEGRRRRDELAAAVELQNYQFNCHGVELGQRYESCAVVDDGTAWPEPDRDPELYYQPTTRPGARLPHARLEHGDQPQSTLDLCGRGRFTLLTGNGGEPWCTAADQLADELGIPLDTCTIGLGCAYRDVYGDWARLRGTAETGALLVRPDGHVAWRHHELATDPGAALRDALNSVLRRDPATLPHLTATGG